MRKKGLKMEEITQGVDNINLVADSYKKNRIQVSNTKKPLFFYVNLAKIFPFFIEFFTLFYENKVLNLNNTDKIFGF